MPELNGVDTVDQIQKIYPEVPVLYISGTGDEALFSHDAVAGEPVILKNPFTPQVLKQHLHEALSVSVA